MPDDGQTLEPGALAADAHARQVKAMTSGGTASKSKPQYQQSTATFENFQSNTVAVVIPATYADLESGVLLETLASIRNQTDLPDEVVIRFSSSAGVGGEIPTLESVLRPIPSVVLSTSKYQNPGQNRNVATTVVKSQFISFFDSDDEMHPLRVNTLRKLFTNTPKLDMILHGLTFTREGGWPLSNDASMDVLGKTWLCENERRSGAAGTLWLDHSSLKHIITHGHVSIRKDVLKRHRFGNERSGEDCKFVRSVLQDICSSRDREAVLVDEPFTFYIPRSQALKSVHTK
jgi:hypothetical protein